MVSATQHRDSYRPDIDGLRAVAVMAVVLHHLSHSWVPGGFVGVDVFFVISGYLITKIILREMDEGSFTFVRFYERRIRRLFPALFAVLAFVLIVGWFVLLPSDYLATARAAAGTVVFSANIVFWRDLIEGYFAADAKLNPLLHMWSLGVEEQFYLLFPVFLLLVHRYARNWLVPAMLAAFVLSLGLSIVMTPIKSVASYFLLPTRAWELLSGALLAVFVLPQPRSRTWREVLAGVSLLAIMIPVMLYSAKTSFPGYAALLPVSGAAMLIWLGGGPQTLVSRLLCLRPVVYVGLISYSLYLWHWPLIVFARFINGFEPIRPIIPLLLVLSLSAAALSHRVIENAFRKPVTVRRGGGKLALTASTLSVALLAMAGLAVMTNGFPSRYPADAVRDDAVRRAAVPYKQCQNRIGPKLEDLCVIGDASATPDVLLWGDSHMLAWAPGFDEALKDLGRSAYLAPNSSCPPILGVEQSTDPLCRSQNDDVAAAISRDVKSGGSLDKVVLAGFWQKYFNESNVVLSSDRTSGRNFDVAAPGIVETIEHLSDAGISAVVLGPLPVYPIDVAYAVSAGRELDRKQTYADMQSAREYKFLEDLPGFVDVASWFCSDACTFRDEGGVLYRDSNHLSIHGARRFRRELADALSRPQGRTGQ